jgi:hypothetical protein
MFCILAYKHDVMNMIHKVETYKRRMGLSSLRTSGDIERGPRSEL